MGTEENKALLRRYYAEVLGGGNIGLIDELFAPDFVSAGVDLARFKELAAASRAAFPDLHVTVEDQVAEGDKVVTRFSAHGTHRGPFAGIPATGKPVTVRAIHIHRIAHGKIAELWEQIDLLGLMQQVGKAP
jgi:steroid delta-isomerase-like uncharacterized protein